MKVARKHHDEDTDFSVALPYFWVENDASPRHRFAETVHLAPRQSSLGGFRRFNLMNWILDEITFAAVFLTYATILLVWALQAS